MNLDDSVVVLGAGASKGAHVKGVDTPPLDHEFLAVAANRFRSIRARGKNKARGAAWRDFKKQLIKAGLHAPEIKNWKLEQLSTFLEARSNLKGLQLGVGKPRDYTRALNLLNQVVAHVLAATGGTESCGLHRLLFETADPWAVLTFNYDLIADQTLMEMGKLNWKLDQYSGSGHASIPTEDGGRYFRKFHAGQMRGSIKLLKLHGSMNWEKLDRGESYRLSGVRPPQRVNKGFEFIEIPDEPYIIPPVAAKVGIKEGPLREHWYRALDQLHEASRWVIWGYSFPQTDTIAQVLFRTALTRNRSKKPVIVVNPDFSVVKRIEEICQKVKVEYYPSMESMLIHAGAMSVKSAKRPKNPS